MGSVSWLKGEGINTIHPAAVVIFVTVLLGALLLRRSFCSWICPVAVVSEVLWKSGYKILLRNPRPPHWLDVALRGLKYLLMVFFIYSIVIAMSPTALQEFILSDYHKIADVRLLDFFLHISPVALVVILILLALSGLLRNPFCRYLCPYGALLGLIAVLSPLRVTRDTGRCISCGICSQVCPSYIDVMHRHSVHQSLPIQRVTFHACSRQLCCTGYPFRTVCSTYTCRRVGDRKIERPLAYITITGRICPSAGQVIERKYKYSWEYMPTQSVSPNSP
jgi:polyferredoxin